MKLHADIACNFILFMFESANVNQALTSTLRRLANIVSSLGLGSLNMIVLANIPLAGDSIVNIPEMANGLLLSDML